VIVLRQIGSNAKGFDRGRDLRAAHSERADFPCSRQISLHQRRRYPEYGTDVVEAVSFLIGRKQRGDVDIQREEVAQRVAVFRAVETMEDSAAGIGASGCSRVDRRLEIRRETRQRRLVGTRHADRRHHPATNLADDFFPNLGAGRSVGHVHAFQNEPPCLGSLVVAGDTVLVDQRLL
jgi:hypothetical protein